MVVYRETFWDLILYHNIRIKNKIYFYNSLKQNNKNAKLILKTF